MVPRGLPSVSEEQIRGNGGSYTAVGKTLGKATGRLFRIHAIQRARRH